MDVFAACLVVGMDAVIRFAALGIACAVSAAGAWSYRGALADANTAALVAEYATAQHRAVEAAHAETIRLQARQNETNRQQQARLAVLARAADDARSERDGLRDELATQLMQLPDASCAAARQYAATVNSIFGECATAITDLARKADGHALDAIKIPPAP